MQGVPVVLDSRKPVQMLDNRSRDKQVLLQHFEGL
jgi:hypothetical protein